MELILCETLNQSAAELSPFVDLLHERTQGNPFFLGQFLSTIHKEGLLSLDLAAGAWRWDMARIRSSMASDNVVDLMLRSCVSCRRKRRRRCSWPRASGISLICRRWPTYRTSRWSERRHAVGAAAVRAALAAG